LLNYYGSGAEDGGFVVWPKSLHQFNKIFELNPEKYRMMNGKNKHE